MAIDPTQSRAYAIGVRVAAVSISRSGSHEDARSRFRQAPRHHAIEAIVLPERAAADFAVHDSPVAQKRCEKM
jgi:hypothetical protein